MSVVGYYRYKTLADSEKTLNWTVNYVNVASKTVKPIDACGDYKTLKYLDNTGQYRFFPFNSLFDLTESYEQIGKVNKFLTSILTDQSSESVIGKRTERSLLLNVDVTSEQLSKFILLNDSPRVYLYIGSSNSDTSKDWLEVEIEVLTPNINIPRGGSRNIEILVKYPERYSIRMV